jgi:hypothetical protein
MLLINSVRPIFDLVDLKRKHLKNALNGVHFCSFNTEILANNSIYIGFFVQTQILTFVTLVLEK